MSLFPCDEYYYHNHHHYPFHHLHCNYPVADCCPRRRRRTEITVDKRGFEVIMDVQQFKPDEISVKTIGDIVVIEGKHKDRDDIHGCIARHFVRKYILPRGYDPKEVKSTLTSDKILTVKAPPPPDDETEMVERIVEIQQFGSSDTSKNNNSNNNDNDEGNGNVETSFAKGKNKKDIK